MIHTNYLVHAVGNDGYNLVEKSVCGHDIAPLIYSDIVKAQAAALDLFRRSLAMFISEHPEHSKLPQLEQELKYLASGEATGYQIIELNEALKLIFSSYLESDMDANFQSELIDFIKILQAQR